MKTKLIRTLLASALLACSSLLNAGVAVIVHPDNTNKLDESQVRNIYLGKTKVFPDGSEVLPVEYDTGIPARDVFIKSVLKKDEANLNSYWARMIFSSKGKPPKVLNNPTEMKRLIAANKNSIGYIDAAEVDSSVRVLMTIP
jgi:ABC-type phosphate transport system substrate-binding protein